MVIILSLFILAGAPSMVSGAESFDSLEDVKLFLPLDWPSSIDISRRIVVRSFAFYVAAALGEITGSFAFWAWLRLGRSVLWVVPGLASLVVFAFLLTRIDAVFAGRASAGSCSGRRQPRQPNTESAAAVYHP